MSPLVKIRSERDQMSAIERRIADYILENARLLRDYSSQQLADSLGISQSSVVKFSQKLGFKGYPDLKFSIGEAVARENGGPQQRAEAEAAAHPHAALAEELAGAKSRSEEATRLINPPELVDAVAAAIAAASRVLVIGLGGDGIAARSFAARLALLGIAAVHHFDPVLIAPAIASVGERDVLFVFSEHGKQPELCSLARQARKRRGRVVSVTRNTPNALRALADFALLISAHDERPHFGALLYPHAVQQTLDLLFVLLCDGSRERLARLRDNLGRIGRLADT
jgi:DNA-binding MurR/RpiR family transcriptional regulator